MGTTVPVVPGALMATAASNMPVPGSAVGFTVTWNDPGTEPESGFTVSQFPLLLVLPVAVKVVTLELLLETETVWLEATVLPAGNVKLKEFGFAVSEVVPVEFALNVTGIVREPADDDAMLI